MKQFILIVYAALAVQFAFCKKAMDFDFFKVKLHGENDLSKRYKLKKKKKKKKKKKVK